MTSCGHPAEEVFRLCRHLIDDAALGFTVRYTGRGKDCVHLCDACRETLGELVDACAACRTRIGEAGGYEGEPEILVEPSTIFAVHRACTFPWPGFVDLQPVIAGDRARFLGVTADGTLHALDLDAGTSRVIVQAGLELAKPMLRVSRDGALAAVVDEKGVRGAVIDVVARAVIMPLVREDYHAEHCTFPIAFLERADRTLVVWSSAWNRLDIVDPRTGENLTERPQAETRGEHYLDYFHSGIEISPDGRWIADNGWHWHPYGAVVTWSIDAWLANPYESENGPTRRVLAGAGYLWDRPIAWTAGHTLALWGIGDDDTAMISAVRVFDVETGAERAWLAGPAGSLAFDRELFSLSDRLAVWNVARGTRLFEDATVANLAYHPGAKLFCGLADGRVSTMFGADARYSDRVAALAARIDRERAWGDLHVLGDALESEGCDDAGVLAHCHAHAEHADRCWVIDRIARIAR